MFWWSVHCRRAWARRQRSDGQRIMATATIVAIIKETRVNPALPRRLARRAAIAMDNASPDAATDGDTPTRIHAGLDRARERVGAGPVV